MQRLRISFGGLMVTVALCSIEIALVNAVDVNYKGSAFERLVEPVSPLIMSLLAGLYVFARHPNKRPFVTGFEIAGWSVVGVWVFGPWDTRSLNIWCHDRVLMPVFEHAIEISNLTLYSLTHPFYEHGLLFWGLYLPLRFAVLNTLPLGVAVACGIASSRIGLLSTIRWPWLPAPPDPPEPK